MVIAYKFRSLLADLQDTNTTMTSIDLSSTKIGDEGAGKLAEALKINTTVTSINLSCNKIDVEGAGKLAEALKTNTTMASFDLHYNKIGVEGAGKLAEALKTNTTVTSINLSSNKIGAEGAGKLAEALKTNTTMTSINVSYNKIGDEGAGKLAEALKTNTTMTSINLIQNEISDDGAGKLAEALKTNTTMVIIDLSYNKIGDDGAGKLAEALKTNTTITSVNLDRNEIGAEGAGKLAEALKTNTTIASINVSYNKIGAEGAGKLAEALKTNTTMTSITLNGNRIGYDGAGKLAEALKTNTAVTSIDLFYNEIGAKGAGKLAEALKMNTTVTSITLNGNRIGDDGAGKLAEALKTNTTITSVNLTQNEIGADGAGKLAEALKTNTTMTSINLARNKIGDEGTGKLAEALKTNITMTSINLIQNEIGAEGAGKLAEALKTNTIMTSINFGHNKIGAEIDIEIRLFEQRNKVFWHHEKMTQNHSDSFYVTTIGKELKWASENLYDDNPISIYFSEKPVWEAGIHDGAALAHLLKFLKNRIEKDGSEKEKIKRLVEKNTQSDHGNLLHFAASKKSLAALNLCEFLVEEIKVDFDELKDSKNRTARDIAKASENPKMSSWAKSVGTLLGFEVEPSLLHASATAIVLGASNVAATDNSDSQATDLRNRVVLKAMNAHDQVLSELEGRRGLGSKSKRREHVVDVLRLYVEKSEIENMDQLADAAKDLDVKIYTGESFTKKLSSIIRERKQGSEINEHHGFNFLLVLERADLTLADAILHHNIAGTNFLAIRHIAMNIANALKYLHSKKIIHADLKPLNIVRVGVTWQLIDMDVSCKLDDGFGSKVPSSGYCPPEMAKVLKEATDNEMYMVDTSKLKRYKASKAYDLWSFGVVLYYLVTGKPLLNLNKDEAVDLQDVTEWNQDDIDSAIYMRHGKTDDHAVAFDLIRGLLEPSQEKRLERFPNMSKVLEHAFFKSTSLDDADLRVIKDKQEEIYKKLDKIHDGIIEMTGALKSQLQDMQDVLLTGIFESTEVSTPTSCIILPYKLNNANGLNLQEKEDLNLPKCNKDFLEEGAEDDGPPSSEIGKMKKWFNKIVGIGEKLQKKELGDIGAEVAEPTVGLAEEQFFLYLIDEVRGEPVIPEDSDPVYPIVIKNPDEWVGKLMPFMKTGLKVITVTNGLLKVFQCFFPPLIVASVMTESIRNKTKATVGALDKESSIAEFDDLSKTLDGVGEKGNSKKGRRGLELREFERFLEQYDPDKTFCGLRRKFLKHGEKPGTAVWTLLENPKSIRNTMEANYVTKSTIKKLQKLQTEHDSLQKKLEDQKSIHDTMKENCKTTNTTEKTQNSQTESSSLETTDATKSILATILNEVHMLHEKHNELHEKHNETHEKLDKMNGKKKWWNCKTG